MGNEKLNVSFVDSVKNDPDKQIWGAKRPRGVARSFSILNHGQNVRLNP